MLRSNGKQSGESVESVLKKKRNAIVGRIFRKGMFYEYLLRWVSTHPCSHLSPSVDIVSLFEFPDDECNEQQREKTAVNQTDHTQTLNDSW